MASPRFPRGPSLAGKGEYESLEYSEKGNRRPRPLARLLAFAPRTSNENAPLIEYQMFRYNRLDTRPFLAAVLELCRSEKSFWQRIIPRSTERIRPDFPLAAVSAIYHAVIGPSPTIQRRGKTRAGCRSWTATSAAGQLADDEHSEVRHG